MKGKRFTKEQGVDILNKPSTGTLTKCVSRRWKVKDSDMEISVARRMKALKDENIRLKRIVTEQALDIQALMSALSKKT